MTRMGDRFRGLRATIPAAFFAAILAAASTANVFAGGFQLAVEAPGASSTTMKDAVLIVRTFGCHQPENANVSITAEGVVNGQRRSVPVELKADAKGVYAIRQQWPADGKWVLVLTGAYNGMTSTVFVELGEKGTVYADTRLAPGEAAGQHARALRRKPTTGDVDAALKSNIGSIASVAPAAQPVPAGAIAAGSAGVLLFGIGIAALKRRRRG